MGMGVEGAHKMFFLTGTVAMFEDVERTEGTAAEGRGGSERLYWCERGSLNWFS